MSPIPSVTILYAGILGLIALVLAVRVSRTRAALGITLGDGGNDRMLRAIRAHANFIEYVPLCLILIALLELARGPRPVIHALGIALVIARILHPIGLAATAHPSFARGAGAGLTYLVLLIAAIACIYYGVIWHAI